ncbi:transcriptional repressor [Parapedobacter sp. ISTM3]|uniref:Fur family transcriptional regulator n=1 Tax=Parapedobacter sp. ISTM3 TaxID=2800130 RepID=UPI001903242C|nr:transcriptional repressor [Parapedobacter sp. ISTM3]MBK1442131.1 transcriptional repressor [Parapedobacter sp. ISTM3]
MEDLSNLLREHGMRVTRMRRTILKMLITSNRSFSVPELQAHFGDKADRVTLYRVFWDFHSKGLVERIVDIDGVARYIYHDDECKALHPHFRCKDCGTVHGLPQLPKSYMEAMREHLVDSAVLWFSGTCQDCLRRNRLPINK